MKLKNIWKFLIKQKDNLRIKDKIMPDDSLTPFIDPKCGLEVSGKEYRKFETGAQRDDACGKGKPALISPIFIQRLSQLLERGAIKYSERNWEQGMPLCEYINSMMRHTNKLLEGRTEEDHAAAIAFNIMGFIHTKEMIDRGILPKKLDNMPNYVNPKSTPQDI